MSVLVLLAATSLWYWYGHQTEQKPNPSVVQGTKQPQPTPPSLVDMRLSQMSLRDKVASLLITNVSGTDAGLLGQYADTNKLGGAILMGENIPATDTQLKAETAALRGGDVQFPRLVTTDEEGGTVKRLPGDMFPSGLNLKNKTSANVQTAFDERSTMVQSVGITLNFGIIADVTSNPNSFIYERTLGITPEVAADHVAAAVEGSKGKTLSTLKHFPGHGETIDNSHIIIPTINVSYTDWQMKDKIPFAAGIAAGADVVMVGHLRYATVDDQPASLSKKWHDILRNELGFKGLIVTDAMGMLQNSGESIYQDPVQNAVAALNAGNTMLLYVFDTTTRIDPNILIDGIVAAVKNDTLNEALITSDARLALTTRAESASLVK